MFYLQELLVAALFSSPVHQSLVNSLNLLVVEAVLGLFSVTDKIVLRVIITCRSK